MKADAMWITGNTVETASLRVPVRIVDERSVYGNSQCKISPIGGQGAVWVSDHLLEFQDAPPRWVLTESFKREGCDSCGWQIPEETIHYATRPDTNRVGVSRHCNVCHKIGSDWRLPGDSERRER